MPLYKYRAKKSAKEVVIGTIEARTREEAVEGIEQMEYFPIRVEEQKAAAAEGKGLSLSIFKRVRLRELTIFSRQLSSLIKSGVPILRGISIIAEQSENHYLKDILNEIGADVKDGKTLSGALERYPRVFSPLYRAMVRAGEDSGTLQETLLKLADYGQRQEEIISKVRAALAYSLLMAVVGTGTVFFMLTFVIPKLVHIFSSIGGTLPLPTRILISVSAWLHHFWFWLLLFAATVFFLLKRRAKTDAEKVAAGLFKLRLPVVGDFTRKLELARFSRTLEVLIRSGIQILRAIRITVPVLSNEIIKQGLLKVHGEVEQGASFGMSLKKSTLFPPFMSSLITVGESSGRLEEALAEVADSYERDVDEGIKMFTSLLEPLMILGMGLVIGFIVIAMLLPVFQLDVMAR